MACIGGPSALAAGLLYQLNHPDHSVIHCVTNRLDSNHDGSASYYHQRDAAPVYLNRVNRGPYCVYIDLYKRAIGGKRLAELAEKDRHHVKISLNYANIKLRHIFTIFIPNVYHMALDLWLLPDKKKAKMAHVIQHACRAIPIVESISERTGHPVDSMLIHGKNKACYIGFPHIDGKDGPCPKDQFNFVNKFAKIPFEEISREGFGPEVNQVLNFPGDGLVSPTVIESMKRQLVECRTTHGTRRESGEVTRENVQITKLIVAKDFTKEAAVRVTQLEWMDLKVCNRMFVNSNCLILQVDVGLSRVYMPTSKITHNCEKQAAQRPALYG